MPNEAPQAEVLAKILLMQNLVGQLPAGRSVREFLARGLVGLPGVCKALFVGPDEDLPDEPDTYRWPLLVSGKKDSTLVIRTAEAATFAPYAPFVGNLCFTVTAILERAAQRAHLEEHKRVLEAEVSRRTLALRQQVEERERAEHRAIAERERAQFLLAVSELIIVELDREARVRSINERGCALLGYSAHEMIGRNWIELAVPEPERDQSRAVFQTVMLGHAETPHAHQSEVITRSGQRRIISWKNRAERGADGQPIGTISAGEDVTARAESERRTRAEKERLATTLRSIGEGVVTTDVNGIVVDMNEVAQRLTGYSLATARGKRLDEVYRLCEEREHRSVPVDWQAALAKGSAIESPAFVLLDSQDGTTRPVNDCLSPIRDADGNTHGLVLVFRDITERRRLFANLVRSDRLEALGVMAGGIAHDFNNLLGGIFGYMDLAEEESSEPEVKQSLSRARSVFVRAKDLTQQLLTFAKGGTPVKKTIAIGPIVKDNITFALSGSSVACHFDLPDDLWSCDVDKNQIGQVLDNLVINAVQAMPGGGRLIVTAKNEVVDASRGILPAGEYVSVAITDTGEGIPANRIDRVFDPFFTTKQSGAGLGLATCHSIMQRHGGAIEVRSTPGVGTTFTFWLKASHREAQDEGNELPIHHHGTGIVVVMDDEEDLLVIVSRSLERMGYEVVQANHGEAALAAWATLQDRLPLVRGAFLDLTVRGGMGGKDTARALRAAGFSAPLFATSGYSEDPVMARPGEFGFTASLGKPFSRGDLATFMNRWLAVSMSTVAADETAEGERGSGPR